MEMRFYRGVQFARFWLSFSSYWPQKFACILTYYAKGMEIMKLINHLWEDNQPYPITGFVFACKS